ncbi:MAG: DMT family transporter [Clostridia bacterium]|nr:DMT family transporter [Clostridia bacterium]
MKKNRVLGSILMLVAALIWGSAFVAQTVGMESIGPFTFTGIRISLGALALLPVCLIKDRFEAKKNPLQEKRPFFTKRELLYGSMMGLAFFVASNFQQYALLYTTAGKSAFITALYIVFVPLTGVFMKKKVPMFVWAGVAIAFVGLYFLSVSPEESGLNLGDILAFVGSLFFTVQIILIEKSGEETDGVKLSLLQFIVCGALSSILMFAFETPKMDDIFAATVPLLYAGLLSGGVAYTLQIISQRNLDTTVASLLMSMESVFAVLTAWLLIQEAMTPREIFGCVIMFAAIILAQLADGLSMKKNKKKEE